MISEPAPIERGGARPDVAACRAQARRLILMSRGIYILMAGVLLAFAGIWMSIEAPDRALGSFGAPILLGLLLVASVAIQRWRRSRGLGVTAPGDLAGNPPGTPGFRRAMSVLICCCIGGIGAGLFSGLLPDQVFPYAAAAWCVGLGVYLPWRWGGAKAWETWMMACGLIAAAVLIAAIRLDLAIGLGLLAAGLAGIVAGLSLEVRWINWVRTTRSRLAEDEQGEVPS